MATVGVGAAAVDAELCAPLVVVPPACCRRLLHAVASIAVRIRGCNDASLAAPSSISEKATKL